ncbi:hypothetical protein FNV43_RR25813 [Rhamnella rubrinervis]|uniref:4-coumarate--CoA ligase n=1 Tax=Rhamnella rubrinervis TaxID=2594499 RepID=A0A8K0GNQ2_9ROSA|nr:hypothetical protein FNV43_RR25813 [Rhamnella rubrinervis]
MYSSGTTGLFKGVELTHRNWISVLAGLYAIHEAATPPAVALCTVPYFHVYGFGHCMRVIALGGTAVTMGTGRFDLKRMMRGIEQYRVTQVAWSPPIAVAIVRDGSSVTDGYDLRSLEVVQRWCAAEEECNIQVEETVAQRATGAGYLGDKEATSAVMDSEGWLKTGDLCYIDNEGCPSRTGASAAIPSDIVDAVVIPCPDEDAGQVPMAFVVKSVGSDINESQIKAFIAEQVAPYKRIRRLMFIDTIPKNTPGKVLRKELIKLASQPMSKL